MTTQQNVDELAVRNQVVVTVQGEIKFYPISQLGLDFENSTDEEVLQAVANIIREDLNLELPVESYIVSRAAESQNLSLFPKTQLGSNKEIVRHGIYKSSKRLSGKNSVDPDSVEIDLIDIFGNFTLVQLSRQSGKRKKLAVGISKCNPNCDEFDPAVGLNIATARAMKRF